MPAWSVRPKDPYKQPCSIGTLLFLFLFPASAAPALSNLLVLLSSDVEHLTVAWCHLLMQSIVNTELLQHDQQMQLATMVQDYLGLMQLQVCHGLGLGSICLRFNCWIPSC